MLNKTNWFISICQKREREREREMKRSRGRRLSIIYSIRQSMTKKVDAFVCFLKSISVTKYVKNNKDDSVIVVWRILLINY